jgi:hypothetical protein
MTMFRSRSGRGLGRLVPEGNARLRIKSGLRGSWTNAIWKSDFGNLSWFVFLPAASENGLSKDSGADAFQVKSVSVTRFAPNLGEVTDAQIDEIAAAIALCVGVP